MGAHEKKRQWDAALKTLTETAKSKNGKTMGLIVLGVILLEVIILNVFGTTLENKVATQIQVLESQITGIDAHVSKLEEEVGKKLGVLDIGAFKAEAETLRQSAESIKDATHKASENFEAKLNALIKAEEAKLESFTKDLENRKADIDGLKSLITTQ